MRWSLLRPPVFADGRTAALGIATLAAMVAVEAADVSVKAQASDRVDDRRSGQTFAAAMGAAIAVSAASLLRTERRSLPRDRTFFAAGLSTTWLGLGLNRWARRALATNYRPLVTVVDDHKIVVTGPYRFVRHPMYLGATLTCAGVAAALGTPATVAAWLLPPAALIKRILTEESVLSQAFGDAYGAFAESRARLVPGVW
jgi:protein-S-isoprenylcysteine O-methyltransferase Ste14